MLDLLPNLDVFCGDLTPTRAYVYARLPRLTEPGEWSLTGTVRGPRCLHAQTLPMLARLVDQGPGPTLLARAMITEPVFWTPDLPAIYDVTVKLQRGTETIATAQREIGLRSLGVRDRRLWLAGQPYIPRGVLVRSTTARLPREWHDALAMYVCDDASHQPLAEASQWGAMALVEVRASQDLVSRLRELAHQPAVAIAALAQAPPLDFNKKTVCPNLLLAQFARPDQAVVPEAWADLLIADWHAAAPLRELPGQSATPLILRRTLPEPLSLPEARSACDTLQREAAAIGQFAGYLV